jgi:UV DNA damage endonuclease
VNGHPILPRTEHIHEVRCKAGALGVELASIARRHARPPWLRRIGAQRGYLDEPHVPAEERNRPSHPRAETENLAALDRVITFLERRRILLYRITSNLVPFASHPGNRLEWWEEFAPQLSTLGRRFRTLGVRVSTHPGQYTVLNSPNREVVKAAVAELEYHALLLDAIDADRSAKIVLHVGGLYAGSEAVAMDRFCAVASELPDAVRRRLVVENDDRLFDAEEVLSVAQRLKVPVVFDWLHHHANPCRAPVAEVLPPIFATWRRDDGRPKVHLSSQAAGGPPGAHADYIKVADALAFFEVVPPRPFDCMLEAKQKDRALLRLRAALRRRGVMETDVEGQHS